MLVDLKGIVDYTVCMLAAIRRETLTLKPNKKLKRLTIIKNQGISCKEKPGVMMNNPKEEPGGCPRLAKRIRQMAKEDFARFTYS